jgi:hypothetical protein
MTVDTRQELLTDDQILAAIPEGGGRVHRISDRLGLGGSVRPRITRRLLAMERKGLVRRSERHSVANSYFWERPLPPERP